MKFLIILPIILLCACVGKGAYNNEQVRTQCAIGYHEERSYPITLFKTKDSEKDSEKESRFSVDISCVPNSDQDKFIRHHDQN